MSAPASGLRIGDAERAAAADRLAWHFSHGRLDQAELDDRLGRAMHATTAADLTRLFADLPESGPLPAGRSRRRGAVRAQPARAPRRPRLAAIALAFCIVLGVALVLRALTQPFAALAVLAVIAVLWLRRRAVRDRGSPPSIP